MQTKIVVRKFHKQNVGKRKENDRIFDTSIINVKAICRDQWGNNENIFYLKLFRWIVEREKDGLTVRLIAFRFKITGQAVVTYWMNHLIYWKNHLIHYPFHDPSCLCF